MKNNPALFVAIYAVVIFLYLYFVEGSIIPEQNDLVNAIVSGLLAGIVAFALKYVIEK